MKDKSEDIITIAMRPEALHYPAADHDTSLNVTVNVVGGCRTCR